MDTATSETAPENTVTISQVLDRYERDGMDELAPLTKRNYTYHLKTLRAWFGDRIVADLKPKDFAPFLAVKRGHGLAHRVRSLAVLSSALTKGVSQWYIIDRNCLRDVKRPTFPPRDRLITPEEFREFRAMAPLRMQLAMDLALRTGQRQGDILSFKWSDIKDGALHVQQSKTGKRLALELTADLKKVLGKCAQLPGASGSEYILPNQFGRRYTGPGFRQNWTKLREKWIAKGKPPFSFHDIRAMAATNCPTLEMAQALLGHSSPAMTLRVYRRGVSRVQPLRLP